MASQLTTKSLFGRKVVSSKGKKIGKVRRFVFHPSEKRVVGFTVKRPDAALMFHRKDLFVALDGFDIDDDNRIIVHDDPTATDKGARKALDLDWDKCVIWVGMPVMTASGDFIGYIDVVTFDRESGAIVRVSTENGAANDALLGKRIIPASYIKGFRRGQGIALAPMGEYNGEDPDEATETGAILVADRTLELPIEGGAAAAAGKATAVVTDKAKKGAAKGAKSAKKVSATEQARADRRAKVRELADKGWANTRIAKEIGSTASTVKADVDWLTANEGYARPEVVPAR